MQTNEECTICFEVINEFDLYKLECNHKYHTKCLNNWLRYNSTCPNCRRYISKPSLKNKWMFFNNIFGILNTIFSLFRINYRPILFNANLVDNVTNNIDLFNSGYRSDLSNWTINNNTIDLITLFNSGYRSDLSSWVNDNTFIR